LHAPDVAEARPSAKTPVKVPRARLAPTPTETAPGTTQLSQAPPDRCAVKALPILM
jgi:hypothetical protein